MLTSADYFVAWTLYIIAAIAAVAMCWHFSRGWKSRELRHIARICMVAVLLTPTKADPSQSFLVPAIMVAAFEGIGTGLDEAMRGLTPILLVTLVAVVISLTLSFITRSHRSS